MKTLTVRIKSVYGVNKIYPVCDTARMVCELTAQKTLTNRGLAVLKAHGYTVQLEQPTVSL